MEPVDQTNPIDEINDPQVILTPPPNQKFIRIALSFILIVLLISFSLLSKRLRAVLDQMELSNSPLVAAIDKIVPNILPTPTPAPSLPTQQLPTGEKIFNLEYVTDSQIATIAALPEYTARVASWNNKLIFSQFTASQGAAIRQIDLNTREITTLFTAGEYQTSEKLDQFLVTSLEVDGNSLLFSLNAYLTTGYQYVINLENPGPAQQVGSVMSGNWQKDSDGRVWITAGFGDGCAGEIKLYRANSPGWEPQLIADYSTACAEGQRALGVDPQNRLLLAGYSGKPNKIEIPIFTYITSVHITDPSIIEGIIAKQDFPADITSVQYNRDNNQIILASASATIVYDLSTRSASISANSLPENPQNSMFPYESLETKIQHIRLPSQYRWSIIEL